MLRKELILNINVELLYSILNPQISKHFTKDDHSCASSMKRKNMEIFRVKFSSHWIPTVHSGARIALYITAPPASESSVCIRRRIPEPSITVPAHDLHSATPRATEESIRREYGFQYGILFSLTFTKMPPIPHRQHFSIVYSTFSWVSCLQFWTH